MAGNLGYTELTATQSNKVATANANASLFDAAQTDQVSIDIATTSPVTISATDFTNNFIFTLDENSSTPPTGAFTVQVPATSRGAFAVVNNTNYTATIEISGQTMTSPTLTTGEASQFDSDGSNVMKP